ncbi:hypothetical protein NHX12_033629, partial [Muraenolepis orangiensis]
GAPGVLVGGCSPTVIAELPQYQAGRRRRIAVCVLGGSARGSVVGGDPDGTSCARGFPDQEYSIMADGDLQKGQALLN